tara:strand:+ start:462 stop:854 length:393 start_codon:yes stop_codon:yes gene_type:complete
MKSGILSILIFLIGNSLSAQVTLEVCKDSKSEFQLFDLDESGNLNCSPNSKAVILSMSNNSELQEILDNTEGKLSLEQVQKALNLFQAFKDGKLVVLDIDVKDSFGAYRIYCQLDSSKGYLNFSLNSKEE